MQPINTAYDATSDAPHLAATHDPRVVGSDTIQSLLDSARPFGRITRITWDEGSIPLGKAEGARMSVRGGFVRSAASH